MIYDEIVPNLMAKVYSLKILPMSLDGSKAQFPDLFYLFMSSPLTMLTDFPAIFLTI